MRKMPCYNTAALAEYEAEMDQGSREADRLRFRRLRKALVLKTGVKTALSRRSD